MKTRDELLEEYAKTIPDNVLNKGKIFYIDIIRWVEALCVSAIVIGIISLTPFVMKIKIIADIVICLSLFLVILRGFKNRSYLQVINDNTKNKKWKKKYSLEKINPKKKTSTNSNIDFGGESILDKVIHIFKNKFEELDEKYGD